MASLINFFYDGFCKCDPEIFIKSDVGQYLARIYGDLIYTQDPTINFINVYVGNDGEFLLSDCIYCDKFPQLKVVGTILPERNYTKLEKNERGGYSEVGSRLVTKGYYITHLEIPEVAINSAFQEKYYKLNTEYKGWGHICETNKDMNLNSCSEDSKDESFPLSSQIYLEKFYDFFKPLFKESYLLQNLTKADPVVQRMFEGDRMDLHIDPTPLGPLKPTLISSATWIPVGEVKGRDFIVARRSIGDLKNCIDCINEDVFEHEKDYAPVEYSILEKISPSLFSTSIMNDFNPYFCHGVTEMMGSGTNYSFSLNLEIV